jgi:hypothetical protein
MYKEKPGVNTVSFETEFLDAIDVCLNKVLNTSNLSAIKKIRDEFIDLQDSLIKYLDELPINKKDTKWPIALKRKLAHLSNSIKEKELELNPQKQDSDTNRKDAEEITFEPAENTSKKPGKDEKSDRKNICNACNTPENPSVNELSALKEEIRDLRNTVEELSTKLRDTSKYLLNIESQMSRKFSELQGSGAENMKAYNLVAAYLHRLEFIDKSFLYEMVSRIVEVTMKNFPTYDYYRKVLMFGKSSQILGELAGRIGRMNSNDAPKPGKFDTNQFAGEIREFSSQLTELAKRYELNKNLPDLKTFIKTEMEIEKAIPSGSDFKTEIIEKYIEKIDEILNGEQVSETFMEDYFQLLKNCFPKRLVLLKEQMSGTETVLSGVSDRIEELYGVLGLEEILMPFAGVWDDRTHSPDLSAWEVDNTMDNVMVTELIVPGLQTVETGVNGKKTVILRAKVKVKGPESFRQYVK